MGKVTVRIYGQDYTISGDRPEEEIREIAKKVDEKMNEIGKSGYFNSSVEVAVLAALTIGEEALDVEKKISEQESGINKAKEEVEQDYEERLSQLQNKVSEYESNFFDLQMQNIKLKNELERLKGSNGI